MMKQQPVSDRQIEPMRGGRRRRRAIGWVLLSGVVTAITVVAPEPFAAALAPPPTSSTTSTIPVTALPTTTTTTTTTSPVVARPTSTTSTTTPVIARPSSTTSTTTPVIAQQPPPTSTIPSNLAIATTVPGPPDQLATETTLPPTSGETIVLGGLSTDPDDWSDEVLQHLQAEGFDLEALASQSAGGAGAADQLLSNEGCAVNCITSGIAYAVGVGAYLEVTTSVPAIIQIQILDAYPGQKTSTAGKISWGATWPDLQPSTTYQAMARAFDANGNIAVASGSFITLARSARISFQPTVFWIGNTQTVDPWQDYNWHHHAEAYLDGVVQVTGAGTAPALEFDTGVVAQSSVVEVIYVGVYHAHGVDCGSFDQPLWPGGGPPPNSGGHDGCDGWFGAVANGIQLDGYPVNSTSWTGHEFTFPLSTFWGEPVGPPVYLTVNVTVEVSYHSGSP